MKHCLVFASLISPSKMILFEKKYQTFDTVFHHQMKHLEIRQKYSAARRIFNSLLGVSSGDETLHLMFDILLQLIFDGPLKAKEDKVKATYMLLWICGKGRKIFNSFDLTADEKAKALTRDTSSNPELSALREIIYSGWPEKQKRVPVPLRKYWAYRDELSIENGMVLEG